MLRCFDFAQRDMLRYLGHTRRSAQTATDDAANGYIGGRTMSLRFTPPVLHATPRPPKTWGQYITRFSIPVCNRCCFPLILFYNIFACSYILFNLYSC